MAAGRTSGESSQGGDHCAIGDVALHQLKKFRCGAGRTGEYASHRQDCAGWVRNLGVRLNFLKLRFGYCCVFVQTFAGLAFGRE